MGETMETCCVCGRTLPNRYAVAGRCEEPGCGAAFCAMHWNLGSHRCPEHGGSGECRERKTAVPEPAADPVVQADSGREPEGEKKMDGRKDGELLERAKDELTPQARKSILGSVAAMAAKIGRSAGALVERIRGVRSPEAVIAEMDGQLAANRARREPLARRHEELYGEIAAKRKLYLAAPPARRKLLELELKGLLAEYKGVERELGVLLENERVAATVRSRTMELIARGLRKIKESEIDRLADEIEEASADAEDVSGALDDLDKAGVRREREDDAAAFEAELAGFEDEAETMSPPTLWIDPAAAKPATEQPPKPEEETP